MTNQKALKRRVRARAAKTGESYTAARSQVLRRSAAPEPDPNLDNASLVSDQAMQRATGRPFREWVELLDTWGATAHRHPEIARWLAEEHDVAPWWRQSITVGYERARGMRAVHETSTGFSFNVSRTLAADAIRVTDAFTDADVRDEWLPDAPMRERTVRPGTSARFDWDDPPSRLVIGVEPKDAGRVVLNVTHEKLPDADAVERLKAFWRARLEALKELLARG